MSFSVHNNVSNDSWFSFPCIVRVACFWSVHVTPVYPAKEFTVIRWISWVCHWFSCCTCILVFKYCVVETLNIVMLYLQLFSNFQLLFFFCYAFCQLTLLYFTLIMFRCVVIWFCNLRVKIIIILYYYSMHTFLSEYCSCSTRWIAVVLFCCMSYYVVFFW